jgi:hypothetical protein
MKIFLLCLILLLSSGCNIKLPEPHLRFVIVLADETDSFALYEHGEITTMFWQEILPYIAKIANNLQPGEKFCVIGIDEHGFDTDDVRIPIITLDENPLKAVQQKKKIIKDIKNLSRRKEKHRSTDILGALYHAAHFLNKQKDNTHEGLVIIFSDMIQEPKFPTLKDAEKLKFPPKINIYCYYVNATGRDKWEKIVNRWVTILKPTNLEITKDCFYQRGEMQSQFNKVLVNY